MYIYKFGTYCMTPVAYLGTWYVKYCTQYSTVPDFPRVMTYGDVA